MALLEHATPDPMGRMRTAALLTGRTAWTCCHRGPSEWLAATAAVRSLLLLPSGATCLVVKISSALALLTSHPLASLTFIIHFLFRTAQRCWPMCNTTWLRLSSARTF